MNYPKPLRVNRNRPCPISGHIDWCLISRDGEIAYCTRVEVGSFKWSAGYKAWMHRLTGERIVSIPARLRQEHGDANPRAQIERRDVVYRALCAALELRPDHRAELRRRGLSNVAINCNGYRSTFGEERGWEIAKELSRSFDLRGVPGFFVEGDSWRMAYMVEGYLIPVCDALRKIQALSIRRTDGRAGNKYLWFSSGLDTNGCPRKGGASSGAPVHVVYPERIALSDEILLTEGALKADVIAYFTGLPVFAASGVTNFGETFAANLRRDHPHLKSAVVAYDRDVMVKKEVYSALCRLARSLEHERFRVRVRTWPNEHKGFDDYLCALASQSRRLEAVA